MGRRKQKIRAPAEKAVDIDRETPTNLPLMPSAEDRLFAYGSVKLMLMIEKSSPACNKLFLEYLASLQLRAVGYENFVKMLEDICTSADVAKGGLEEFPELKSYTTVMGEFVENLRSLVKELKAVTPETALDRLESETRRELLGEAQNS